MRWRRCCAVLLVQLLCLCACAQGRRKALIMVNNAYTGSGFDNLKGAPIRDGDGMRDALIPLGFKPEDIVIIQNKQQGDMVSALAQFRQGLKESDSVLFYYSGHGFSMDGQNYLVPIGFSFGSTRDAISNSAVSVAEIVDYLSKAKTRIMILDACRTAAPDMKSYASNDVKDAVKGLSYMSGTGSLIAYATSDGKASSALSTSGMSFYTNYLVNSLKRLPANATEALETAKDDTTAASGGVQVPALYNEMAGRFYFAPRPGTAPVGSIAVPANMQTWTDLRISVTWTSADNGSPATFQQAQQYCAALRTNGVSDWRLPTSDELNSLRNYKRKDGQATVGENGDVHLSGDVVWSSTVLHESLKETIHSLKNFKKGELVIEFNTLARALCVRDDWQAGLDKIFELASRDRLSTLKSIRHDDANNLYWEAQLALPQALCDVWTADGSDHRRSTGFDPSGFIMGCRWHGTTSAARTEQTQAILDRLSAYNLRQTRATDRMTAYEMPDGTSLTLGRRESETWLYLSMYPKGYKPVLWRTEQ